MEKTLGQRIAEHRRAKGLTQESVAEHLNVSPQAVSKWENDVSCPDILLLPKLAGLLGVTTDLLLSGETAGAEVQYLPPEARKNFDDMMLRIKVDDCDKEGNTRVRVNLPLPLLHVLLQTGGSIGGISSDKLQSIDLSQIIAMVENGAVGKLVEVDDDSCHVEIVVE